MSTCSLHPKKRTIFISLNRSPVQFASFAEFYPFMEHDLNIIQNFLDRCHKPVSTKDLLERQDCKIFKEVTSINNHPLTPYIPSKKICFCNLRIKQSACPKINTIFSSLPL